VHGLGRRPLLSFRSNTHHDDVFGLEAESNRFETQEALDQEPGAGQQNQRERHRSRGRGLEHGMAL